MIKLNKIFLKISVLLLTTYRSIMCIRVNRHSITSRTVVFPRQSLGNMHPVRRHNVGLTLSSHTKQSNIESINAKKYILVTGGVISGIGIHTFPILPDSFTTFYL